MFIQNALVAAAGSREPAEVVYDITNLETTATNNKGAISFEYTAGNNLNDNPLGTYLSHDGVYYFVADQVQRRIFRYTLSTAFDLSTATLSQSSDQFSSSTIGQPGAIYFKADGSAFFMANYWYSEGTYNPIGPGQRIFKYTLSTDWDITSSSMSLDTTTTADFYLLGAISTIALSTNGDKLFLGTGHSQQIMHTASFALSTNFDISTTSLGTTTPVGDMSGLNTIADGISFNDIIGGSFSTGNSTGSTSDMIFNSTGTKAWLTAGIQDTIYELDLSTAYDLKSFSYNNKSLDTSTEDTSPVSCFWGDSGFKLYVLGASNDTVYQYNATAAYNIGTATYANKSFDLNTATSGLLASPFKLHWKPDGTRFFVLDGSDEAIYQFNVPSETAWDVSTATYTTGDLKSVNPPFSFASYCFDFDPNGGFFIVGGYWNYRISKWTMSTAWDVTSAGSYSTTDRYNFNSDIKPARNNSPYARTVRFLDSGSKLLVGVAGAWYTIVTMQTAYNLSVASWAAQGNTSNYLAPRALGGSTGCGNYVFSEAGTDEGKKILMMDSPYSLPYVITLNTAWDLDNVSSYTSRLVRVAGSQSSKFITASRGSTNNGTYYYVTDSFLRGAFQYEVTTPWSITPSKFGDVRPSTGWARIGESTSQNHYGFTFGKDGEYVYTVDSADFINRWPLTTAYDLTTIGAVSGRWSVNSEDIYPHAVCFKPDGLTMYVLGRQNDRIYQYTLEDEWDVTSASYDNKSLYVGSQESSPYGMAFASNGEYVYVTGSTSDDVFRYSMPTNSEWDISTATFDTGQVLVPALVDAAALAISPDGRKIWVGGGQYLYNNILCQYTLDTAWDLTSATNLVQKRNTVFSALNLEWNGDGSKLYIGTSSPTIQFTNTEIFEYTV
jgi:sugar lactone lactonase YvrE